MATGILYFADLGGNTGITWTDPENVVGQYDVATAVSSSFAVGHIGGGGVTGTIGLGVPTSLTVCKLRFWDTNNEHNDDEIEVRVVSTGVDSLIELFDGGNQLPATETEFDYTTELQVLFAAAPDKKVFLDSLSFRWIRLLGNDPADGINISTQGVYIEYEYIPSVLTKTFTISARLPERATKDFIINAQVVERLTKEITLDAKIFSPAPTPPRPIGYDPDFGTPAHHEFIVVVGHKNVSFGEF